MQRGTGDDGAVVKPGPGNALGNIKFLLPNRHNVYLHDTPSHALFNKDRRALRRCAHDEA